MNCKQTLKRARTVISPVVRRSVIDATQSSRTCRVDGPGYDAWLTVPAPICVSLFQRPFLSGSALRGAERFRPKQVPKFVNFRSLAITGKRLSRPRE